MSDKKNKTNILDYIKKPFKKNYETQIVDELAKSYHKRKERGDEHPIDATIDQIMDIIKNSQDPDETAQKIITAAIDANTMPNRIPEKLSIIISKDENLSDDIVSKAVGKTNTDVPDEMINTIIEEGAFEQSEILNLIKNVDDESLVQKRIKKEFNTLYKSCKDKRDDEVVSKILELKQFVLTNKIDVDFNEMIIEIVAKKMAENYYSNISRGTNLYRLSKAVCVTKMFEMDIASKVEEEFLKIEKQRGKKEENRFIKSELDKQILLEIAKDIGYKSRKTGRFNIPHLQRLQDISNELESKFIETMTNASDKNELTHEELQLIKIQIRGSKKVDEEKEYQLIKKIRLIENKSEYLDTLLDIVSNEEYLKTVNMISKSSLIEKLSLIKDSTREKTIEKITETVNNKCEKIYLDKEDIEK